MQPVKVIAVASGKGGVGKTSVSINLACQLAHLGQKVLLLDADLGLANADILLGVRPKWTLADVMAERCSLDEAIVKSPSGVRLIPAASGVKSMVDLNTHELAGLIGALSELEENFDVLLVDSAAGISDSVLTLSGACHHVLVVSTPEPTAIADAYALIKLLNRDTGVPHFQVVFNMCDTESQARGAFERLNDVAHRFLDINLFYAGSIPRDTFLNRAIRQQTPVVEQFPGSAAAQAIHRLAKKVDQWPIPEAPSGRLEFFVDRLAQRPPEHAGVEA